MGIGVFFFVKSWADAPNARGTHKKRWRGQYFFNRRLWEFETLLILGLSEKNTYMTEEASLQRREHSNLMIFCRLLNIPLYFGNKFITYFNLSPLPYGNMLIHCYLRASPSPSFLTYKLRPNRFPWKLKQLI